MTVQELALFKKWIISARNAQKGDRSEWAQAWRRALSQFGEVAEAVHRGDPPETVMKIGE